MSRTHCARVYAPIVRGVPFHQLPLRAVFGPCNPAVRVVRTGPLQVLDSLNPLSEDAEHRSVIDKNWKEGVDYFRVEPPLTCHDGESVQVGLGRLEQTRQGRLCDATACRRERGALLLH